MMIMTTIKFIALKKFNNFWAFKINIYKRRDGMEINTENRDKIIALLREGVCPICGKIFKSPVTHISVIHGMSRFELKGKLMIGQRHGFASPELSEKYRKLAIKHNTSEVLKLSQSGLNKIKEKICKQCGLPFKRNFPAQFCLACIEERKKQQIKDYHRQNPKSTKRKDKNND